MTKAPGLLLAGAVTLLGLASPAVGRAESPSKAGTVTAVAGPVTVARQSANPHPLRFRDSLFWRDVVEARKDGIARVLLAGKTTVTVRELSRLELRQEVMAEGIRYTADLVSGKVRASVARMLMRPGDQMEIRTKNAVASVRGTDFIVETLAVPSQARAFGFLAFRQVAQAVDGGSQIGETVVITLSGAVDVSNRLAGTSRVEQVRAYEAVRLSGRQDPVRFQLSADDLRVLLQGLTPPRPQEARSGDKSDAVGKKVERVALATSAKSVRIFEQAGGDGRSRADSRSAGRDADDDDDPAVSGSSGSSDSRTASGRGSATSAGSATGSSSGSSSLGSRRDDDDDDRVKSSSSSTAQQAPAPSSGSSTVSREREGDDDRPKTSSSKDAAKTSAVPPSAIASTSGSAGGSRERDAEDDDRVKAGPASGSPGKAASPPPSAVASTSALSPVGGGPDADDDDRVKSGSGGGGQRSSASPSASAAPSRQGGVATPSSASAAPAKGDDDRIKGEVSRVASPSRDVSVRGDDDRAKAVPAASAAPAKGGDDRIKGEVSRAVSPSRDVSVRGDDDRAKAVPATPAVAAKPATPAVAATPATPAAPAAPAVAASPAVTAAPAAAASPAAGQAVGKPATPPGQAKK